MQDRLKQLFNNYVAEGSPFSMRRCLGSRQEADGVVTFEFEGAAGLGGSAPCRPGQYATFDFSDVEAGQTLNRTWTVSSTQEEMKSRGSFTITVKKVGICFLCREREVECLPGDAIVQVVKYFALYMTAV